MKFGYRAGSGFIGQWAPSLKSRRACLTSGIATQIEIVSSEEATSAPRGIRSRMRGLTDEGISYSLLYFSHSNMISRRIFSKNLLAALCRLLLVHSRDEVYDDSVLLVVRVNRDFFIWHVRRDPEARHEEVTDGGSFARALAALGGDTERTTFGKDFGDVVSNRQDGSQQPVNWFSLGERIVDNRALPGLVCFCCG